MTTPHPGDRPHCSKCRTDVDAETHLCLCGTVGEYECIPCQEIVIHVSGRELRHNPCGSVMKQIGTPRPHAPTHDNPCTCSYREHPGGKSTGLHHAADCPMRTEGGMVLWDIADLFVRSLPIKKRPVALCKCGHTDSAHVRIDNRPACGVHNGDGERCRCLGFSLR